MVTIPYPFVTLLAALAQMERKQIGERTKMAMDRIVREGRARSSRLPFGYRVKGSKQTTLEEGDRSPLVKHPKEQAILRRMLKMRAERRGNRRVGARTIARTLNDEGKINPRTKRPWSPSTVAAILRTVERREAALAQ